MTELELLAPARDRDCGMQAIAHGADAVYIGAPRFGARAAASNSMEDVAELIAYAHDHDAKVYIALNTLLEEEELKIASEMAHALHLKGADAIIVQDIRLAQKLHALRIPIHASTQMDNRTPQQVEQLYGMGFEQAVLARELDIEEISAIHSAVPKMRLEAFVHGALCMSYSGRCHISEHLHGRSANRGECAQVCRLNFDLVAEDGTMIKERTPLLSLKDLDRSSQLSALINAGVSSFKIEGRLKDAAYTRNITAYYHQKLQGIVSQHPELYIRASQATTEIHFTPDPSKTFHRTYTTAMPYREVQSLSTAPFHKGEEMGTVLRVFHDCIVVEGKQLTAGDGVLLVREDNETTGFRANKVMGNRVYFWDKEQSEAQLKPFIGAKLYRNHDHAFLSQSETSTRYTDIGITLREIPFGFALDLVESNGKGISMAFECEKQTARKPQQEYIAQQLSRLGDTPFRASKIDVLIGDSFIPASLLGEWRRAATALLLSTRRTAPIAPPQGSGEPRAAQPLSIANSEDNALMHSRYCIRRELGKCLRKESGDRQQWYLQRGQHRFRLQFDCNNCEMKVYAV